MTAKQRALPAFDAAKLAFLFLVALLVWMKPLFAIGGLGVVPADLVFLAVATFWAVALLRGEVRPRWQPAFWLLLGYFAAIALSVTQSADPARSAFKLATQAYLLALPVLAYQLVTARDDLRRVFAVWLAASAMLAVLAAVTLMLFPLLGRDSVLEATLHDYGTLPPGPYPRLEMTFDYPAMLANYLTVSLMILLVCRAVGWIGSRLAWLLGLGIVAAAFFALTPGFGGLLLAIGAWVWFTRRGINPTPARVALIAGIAGGLVFTLAAALTPIVHPTAPFLLHLPGFERPVAPSVRLLAWIDAVRNFAEAPIFGRGIGLDSVHLAYVTPQGLPGDVTDAHNGFLNIAVQCGLASLAAFVALLVSAGRLGARGRGPLSIGLLIALLSGMAFQGLVGSFEDARHLWIVFGLLLAASRIEGDGAVPDAGFEPATFGLQNRCSTS